MGSSNQRRNSSHAALLALLAIGCEVDSRSPDIAMTISPAQPEQGAAGGAGAEDMALPGAAGASPCSGPDCSAGPAQVSGGNAALSCQPGTLACSMSGLPIPTLCNPSGVWEEQAPCLNPTAFCFRGSCLACTPGNTRCSPAGGNLPEVCSMQGSWQPGTACGGDTPVCMNGACVDAGNGCSLNSDCVSGACIEEQCTECMPGALGCTGDTPRSCSAQGSWLNATACSGSTPACNRETGTCGPDEWIRQFGSVDQEGDDVARALIVDAGGGVLVAGDVEYLLALESPGGFGLGDGFLRKYDDAGYLLWSKQFGTPATEEVKSVVATPEGDAIVMGRTLGSIGVVSSGSGGVVTFLIKYSALDGTELWRKELDLIGDRMVLTQAGAIVLLSSEASGANTLSQLDAAAQPLWSVALGTRPVTSLASDGEGNILVSAGGEAAYVTKYARDGVRLWERPIPIATVADDFVAVETSVAADAAGNVLVTGYYWADADPDYTTFTKKYDPNAAELWTSRITCIDPISTTNAAGNIFLTCTESTEFGDVYAIKLASDGTELARRTIGNTDTETIYGIAVDTAGAPYVTGSTRRALPGQTATGRDYDAFLMKLQF